MVTYFIYLFVGFFGGILSAILIPSYTNMEQFISSIILDPISFVMGMFFFLGGFLANAALLRNSIELTYAYFKGSNISIAEIFLSIFCLVNVVPVFFINYSVFIVFSCMTLIYGMISIKLKRHVSLVRDREET